MEIVSRIPMTFPPIEHNYVHRLSTQKCVWQFILKRIYSNLYTLFLTTAGNITDPKIWSFDWSIPFSSKFAGVSWVLSFSDSRVCLLIKLYWLPESTNVLLVLSLAIRLIAKGDDSFDFIVLSKQPNHISSIPIPVIKLSCLSDEFVLNSWT